jgi:hypothetical protein
LDLALIPHPGQSLPDDFDMLINEISDPFRWQGKPFLSQSTSDDLDSLVFIHLGK